LQTENIKLRGELIDTQLDLDDAKKSRRELQQQVNLLTQRMGQSTAESEYIKVCVYLQLDRSKYLLFGQNRNPYIMVLVDGDGLIVSALSLTQNSCS
jgi:hypothetical protein